MMKARKLAVRDRYGTVNVLELGGTPEQHTHLWEDITDAPDMDKLVQVQEDGKIPNSALPENVVTTEGTGKIPNSALPENVVTTDEDGKLPDGVLPGVENGENPLVFGSADGTAGKFDRQSAVPSATEMLRYNGFFRATRVYGMYYSDEADYAEGYLVQGDIKPGEVVEIGEDGTLRKSSRRGNPAVLGIVSTAPAGVIGMETGQEVPVALAGRVPVLAVGKIAPGDFLMSADYPGAVEKAENAPRGAVVAQALEKKDTTEPGKILALVVRL